MDIAVIGSGAWGTALSCLLYYNGHNVTLWSHRAEAAEHMRQNLENPRLPGTELPPDICCTSNADCVKGKRLVVMATPSFAARSAARLIASHVEKDALLVSVTKGIEEGTGLRMSEIMAQETKRNVVALSGPSHAEDVSRRLPTGVVAANSEKSAAELVQKVFMNGHFRVYTSPDIVGVELGAALKNIIALCAGICDGMNSGDNAKALLMTRGLEETARLGLALGARRETFAGLAGMGDLIVTCTSMHSRNRRAGIFIGQGLSAGEAMERVGAVVEGYYAVKSALELSKKVGIEMPITQAAYNVLYNGASSGEITQRLMLRRGTTEHEHAVWAK